MSKPDDTLSLSEIYERIKWLGRPRALPVEIIDGMEVCVIRRPAYRPITATPTPKPQE